MNTEVDAAYDVAADPNSSRSDLINAWNTIHAYGSDIRLAQRLLEMRLGS